MKIRVKPVQAQPYQVLPRSLTARLPGSLALADPSRRQERRERRVFIERREMRVLMVQQCWDCTGSSLARAQGPDY